jgi:hypothetical protein
MRNQLRQPCLLHSHHSSQVDPVSRVEEVLVDEVVGRAGGERGVVGEIHWTFT